MDSDCSSRMPAPSLSILLFCPGCFCKQLGEGVGTTIGHALPLPLCLGAETEVHGRGMWGMTSEADGDESDKVREGDVRREEVGE